MDDRTEAKKAVLFKVNAVFTAAGLNNQTVWSIRDCDSTLFVLLYKKLVGKVCRGRASPGLGASACPGLRRALPRSRDQPRSPDTLARCWFPRTE